MKNLLGKMMSIRNLREAVPPMIHPAAPTETEDEDNQVVMQEPETEEMQPIPNFAEAGITDHNKILEELIRGPIATVIVGKGSIPVHQRLLMYHCNIDAGDLFDQDNPRVLNLEDHDPHAFFQIYRWMLQDQFGILAHCTRSNISAGLQDACTLLCRMFAMAAWLDITAIKPLILAELRAAFTTARNAGKSTPITPSTLMEVWEDGGFGEYGNYDEGYEVWNVVLKEMCVAFSEKPMPVYADYDACFQKIEPLRLAVGKAMGNRILLASEDGGYKVEGGKLKTEVV